MCVRLQRRDTRPAQRSWLLAPQWEKRTSISADVREVWPRLGEGAQLSCDCSGPHGDSVARLAEPSAVVSKRLAGELHRFSASVSLRHSVRTSPDKSSPKPPPHTSHHHPDRWATLLVMKRNVSPRAIFEPSHVGVRIPNACESGSSDVQQRRQECRALRFCRCWRRGWTCATISTPHFSSGHTRSAALAVSHKETPWDLPSSHSQSNL